ncbi:MAG: MmoB/DmpM family protein [Firmicutes bacterium]|jgi:propane monooxygenase coupling protein|uniref:Monooxygenase n=1 Tax=Sulfobacillus benefaciens TaxID=453960 RepID=A0A2T2X9Y4_9FIRM|nr:MmoB/DmpM family protein [Bacillota bacterium]MCL5015379.1 MmoB/DmpM family protein [Bacillota bacterium]PSR31300.1 MAG: monooxygenase [Sulfobacillus benefaciens]HBQ94027.1 monooxygenase [Sulfobacillus sp.]
MSTVPEKLGQDISTKCGVTLNDSVESRVIAEVMSQKPGVSVTYYPAMIRIDGENRLEFDMNELSEALGFEMTPSLFEVETSTHYGRMVRFDDKVILFGRLEDALQYEADE